MMEAACDERKVFENLANATACGCAHDEGLNAWASDFRMSESKDRALAAAAGVRDGVPLSTRMGFRAEVLA
jgi:hypothetical protein